MWIYIILLVVFVVICKRLQNPLRHLPGPTGWPLLGNIPQLDMSASFLTVNKWAKSYGSLFKFAIFTSDFVMISGEDAMKEVMVTHSEDFPDRPKSFRLGYFTDGYRGLVFSSYSGTVKWMRKFTHQHLHLYGTGMKHVEKITTDEVKDFLQKLTKNLNKPVDPVQYAHDAALAIIYIILFGESARGANTNFDMLNKAHMEATKALAAFGSGVFLDMFPWLRYFGNDDFKKLTNIKTVYNHIYNVSKAKYDLADGSLQGMVKEMFKALETVGTRIDFGPLDIINLIRDLMAGGSLTTTSSLGSLFNILAHNINVQEQLKKEVDRVVGPGRLVQLNDQENMPYTYATVIELIRYTTPTPFALPRLTVCNTQVCGIPIPKGTTVLLNIWGHHHDDNIWGDPFTFRPDRFLDADGQMMLADHPLRQAFIGFGRGARRCVGENLAMTRIFLFMSNLMQRFHVLPATTLEAQTSCHPADMVQGDISMPRPYQVRFAEWE